MPSRSEGLEVAYPDKPSEIGISIKKDFLIEGSPKVMGNIYRLLPSRSEGLEVPYPVERSEKAISSKKNLFIEGSLRLWGIFTDSYLRAARA